MKFKNLNGTVFLVPLINGGYALGLVSRHYQHGTLFYFFNVKYSARIEEIPLEKININNVLWVKLGGDGAFIKGVWPILGKLENWEKDSWPIPIFKSTDILRGFPIAIYINENLTENSRKRITDDEAKKIKWKSGIAGTAYIEEELSELFDQVSN